MLILRLRMIEHFLASFTHPVVESSHHDHHITYFPHKPLIKALGLNDAPSLNPSPSIDGPVEYVFKVGTSEAIKNAEGILVPTGAPKSIPFISFIGDRGESEVIPVKFGMKSGQQCEFSAVAKDVGAVKAIRLSNPNPNGASWLPTSVQVNRIGPSTGKGTFSVPVGWVTFDVNKAITEPTVISLAPSGPPAPMLN